MHARPRTCRVRAPGPTLDTFYNFNQLSDISVFPIAPFSPSPRPLSVRPSVRSSHRDFAAVARASPLPALLSSLPCRSRALPVLLSFGSSSIFFSLFIRSNSSQFLGSPSAAHYFPIIVPRLSLSRSRHGDLLFLLFSSLRGYPFPSLFVSANGRHFFYHFEYRLSF